MPCFFRSLISNRLAAFVFRRVGTIHRKHSHLGRRRAKANVFGRRWKSYLVEVPDIAVRWSLAPWLPGLDRAELPAPSPYGLIGNSDAAFQQHFFDHAQAQREPEIETNCMGDDVSQR
jgi:hypothetical protein